MLGAVVAREDHDLVRLVVEARARLRHVVHDEQVAPLASELGATLVERVTGLGGEADDDLVRRGASPRRRRARRRSARARSSARRRSRRSFDSVRCRRAEVRDGGRQHDDVGVARDVAHGVEHLARGLDVDARRSSGATAASSASGDAVTRTTLAPRRAATSAIAWPWRPDERFVSTRTGSIGSRVPPAVTTTVRPRSGPSGGSSTREHRRDDPLGGRQSTGALVAACEAPRLGLDDAHASSAQDVEVVRDRSGAPTSRRASPGRRRPARPSRAAWP